MELLSEIWDKTTDAMTSFSEGVSSGLIRMFGNSNERQIRRMRPIVARINELEPGMHEEAEPLYRLPQRVNAVALDDVQQLQRRARRPALTALV